MKKLGELIKAQREELQEVEKIKEDILEMPLNDG